MEPPRLYHFRISHYNEKVRWALDYKEWPHHRTALVPGFHLPIVRLLTGQHKLPALRLDGRMLVDSSKIIAELERLRPEPPLFPRDEAALSRALAIEEYFDEEVAPDLRRLFWSTYLLRNSDAVRLSTDGADGLTRAAYRVLFPMMRPLFLRNLHVYPEEIEQSRRRLPLHVDRLESEIGRSGYLVGDGFTIADLTAAAVMSAIVRPPLFSYPLPDPWPPELVELKASIVDRPGIRWVEEIYRKHRGASFEIGHSPTSA